LFLKLKILLLGFQTWATTPSSSVFFLHQEATFTDWPKQVISFTYTPGCVHDNKATQWSTSQKVVPLLTALLTLSFKRGNWVTHGLNNSPKVIQAKRQSQACLTQSGLRAGALLHHPVYPSYSLHQIW
jgi:hypothetical protein